jgi:hypothetical protein
MQTQQPIYKVSFKGDFYDYHKAITELKELAKLELTNERNVKLRENDLEITYYIPQPQYKSWVPNWLIRLITK